MREISGPGTDLKQIEAHLKRAVIYVRRPKKGFHLNWTYPSRKLCSGHEHPGPVQDPGVPASLVFADLNSIFLFNTAKLLQMGLLIINSHRCFKI